MDPQPAPFRKRIITIAIDHTRKVALVRGWGARELVIESGHKPLYSASGRGWCIDAKFAPDVEAMAQLERRIVIVREVGDGT